MRNLYTTVNDFEELTFYFNIRTLRSLCVDDTAHSNLLVYEYDFLKTMK